MTFKKIKNSIDLSFLETTTQNTTQMKYLSKNNYGYYSFRIKVPMAYRSYFNQTEIIKSLKTKSYSEARKLCTLLTSENQKLLQTLKLGIFSKEEETSLVNKYLSNILSKPTKITNTSSLDENLTKTAQTSKSISDGTYRSVDYNEIHNRK